MAGKADMQHLPSGEDSERGEIIFSRPASPSLWNSALDECGLYVQFFTDRSHHDIGVLFNLLQGFLQCEALPATWPEAKIAYFTSREKARTALTFLRHLSIGPQFHGHFVIWWAELTGPSASESGATFYDADPLQYPVMPLQRACFPRHPKVEVDSLPASGLFKVQDALASNDEVDTRHNACFQEVSLQDLHTSKEATLEAAERPRWFADTASDFFGDEHGLTHEDGNGSKMAKRGRIVVRLPDSLRSWQSTSQSSPISQIPDSESQISVKPRAREELKPLLSLPSELSTAMQPVGPSFADIVKTSRMPLVPSPLSKVPPPTEHTSSLAAPPVAPRKLASSLDWSESLSSPSKPPTAPAGFDSTARTSITSRGPQSRHQSTSPLHTTSKSSVMKDKQPRSQPEISNHDSRQIALRSSSATAKSTDPKAEGSPRNIETSTETADAGHDLLSSIVKTQQPTAQSLGQDQGPSQHLTTASVSSKHLPAVQSTVQPPIHTHKKGKKVKKGRQLRAGQQNETLAASKEEKLTSREGFSEEQTEPAVLVDPEASDGREHLDGSLQDQPQSKPFEEVTGYRQAESTQSTQDVLNTQVEEFLESSNDLDSIKEVTELNAALADLLTVDADSSRSVETSNNTTKPNATSSKATSDAMHFRSEVQRFITEYNQQQLQTKAKTERSRTTVDPFADYLARWEKPASLLKMIERAEKAKRDTS